MQVNPLLSGKLGRWLEGHPVKDLEHKTSIFQKGSGSCLLVAIKVPASGCQDHAMGISMTTNNHSPPLPTTVSYFYKDYKFASSYFCVKRALSIPDRVSSPGPATLASRSYDKSGQQHISVSATAGEHHTASPAGGIDDESDDNKSGQKKDERNLLTKAC
jgi:hypothetical protein